MAPSTRRKAQMPSEPAKANVNLYCARCDSQLGIFDNEWIRLTSSYVRPVRPGTHFGSEVTRKTQVVPEGVSQPALQGCTLSEVACKKCSAPVGQFCKAAPTRQQESLIDQYFYKLSRTYLKDSETNDHAEPTFVFGGDVAHTKPGVAGRLSLSIPSATATSIPRMSMSQTPSRASPDTPLHNQPQPLSEPQLPPSYRRSPLYKGVHPRPKDDDALLEMRLRSYEERLASQNARLQQQDTQIQLLTSLVNTFRESVEDMRITMRELQSHNVLSPIGSLAKIKSAEESESTDIATRHGRSGSAEVERLRAENAAMRTRLTGIASVMGVASGNISEIGALSGPQSALGKRKRIDGVTRSVSPRLPEPTRQHDITWSTQIPTPQSGSQSGIDQFHDVLTASTNVSSEGESGGTGTREPIQQKRQRQEKASPSANRESTVPRHGFQPKSNHNGTAIDEAPAASTPTGSLHETSGDDLERSGSALLNLFTGTTLAAASSSSSSSLPGDHIINQQQRETHDPPDDPVTRTDIDTFKLSDNHLSITNVEFSDDDDPGDEFSRHEEIVAATHDNNTTQSGHGAAQNDSSQFSVPSRQAGREPASVSPAGDLLQPEDNNSKGRGKTVGETKAQTRSKRKIPQPKTLDNQGRLNHTSQAIANTNANVPPRTTDEPPEKMAVAALSNFRQEAAEIVSSQNLQVKEASWGPQSTIQTADQEPRAAETRLSRRQQRENEIRRRDQLAKEAMEMDD